jgi:hypothetical protein
MISSECELEDIVDYLDTLHPEVQEMAKEALTPPFVEAFDQIRAERTKRFDALVLK